MQIQSKKPELWIVRWYHIGGYQAPDQFIEVNPSYLINSKGEKILRPSVKAEAIKLAKQKSQLGKFPKKWHYKVTNLAGLN